MIVAIVARRRGELMAKICLSDSIPDDLQCVRMFAPTVVVLCQCTDGDGKRWRGMCVV